jgi:hypothetical protein
VICRKSIDRSKKNVGKIYNHAILGSAKMQKGTGMFFIIFMEINAIRVASSKDFPLGWNE